MNINKFTQKSIEAVNQCEKIAYDYGNQEIDQEHFLYSLLTIEDSLIASLIEKMGIDKDTFIKNIETLLSQKNKVSGNVQLYVSNDLNKVLVNAEDEAKRMGDAYVSVEHLMLAMIAAPNKGIKQLFKTYGINRESFLSALATVRGNQSVTSDNPEATYDTLSKYATDLVERAKDGKLDPVIGRDNEIRNVIRILSRKTKNNPVLIGEPGVGKTAVVEGLAQRIVRGDVPEGLKDMDFVLRGVLPRSLRGGYTGSADEIDCHEEHSDEEGKPAPIWKAALRHTLEIFVFIFVFSLVFGLIVEGVGEDVFADALGRMGFFQPVVAALVGLIPNCAASVLLTQLYVEGALRFSSLVAGLCTGAGVGLAVLWRANPSWKQNLFITGLTWAAGAAVGVGIQIVVAIFG